MILPSAYLAVYLVLLDFLLVFYWFRSVVRVSVLVSLGFNGFYWVFTGFLLAFIGFYWVALNWLLSLQAGLHRRQPLTQ